MKDDHESRTRTFWTQSSGTRQHIRELEDKAEYLENGGSLTPEERCEADLRIEEMGGLTAGFTAEAMKTIDHLETGVFTPEEVKEKIAHIIKVVSKFD